MDFFKIPARQTLTTEAYNFSALAPLTRTIVALFVYRKLKKK